MEHIHYEPAAYHQQGVYDTSSYQYEWILGL
jgi:hypothetical protein